MWNFVKKVIGRIAPVIKSVGNFVKNNHQYIAPLAHGLAVASGSETAQKITGLGLAASKMVQLRQNLNVQNAQAHQARMAAGKPNGLYNADTGQVR